MLFLIGGLATFYRVISFPLNNSGVTYGGFVLCVNDPEMEPSGDQFPRSSAGATCFLHQRTSGWCQLPPAGLWHIMLQQSLAGGQIPSMANFGWHGLFHCSHCPLPPKFSISFSLLQMEVVSTFKRSGSFQGAVRRRSSVLSQLHDVTNISTPTHVILSAANASAGAGSES